MNNFIEQAQFWARYINPNNQSKAYTRGLVRYAFWQLLSGINE